MVRVFCGVCGAIAERSLNEAEHSCDTCEMAAGMQTVDADLEERGKLRTLLERLGGRLLQETPNVASSVLPAFRHMYALNSAMLDLLVLFFARTVLVVDSIDFEASDRARIEERIAAYSEAGLLIPLYLHPKWESMRPQTFVRSVDLDARFRQTSDVNEYPRPLHYYLQMIGELETQDDVRASPAEYRRADAAWFTDTKYPHPSLLLNRANIFSAVGGVINGSVLFDALLTKARTLKYQHRLSQLNAVRRAVDSVASWYGKEILTLPTFKKPEMVIAFRNSDAGQSFVDTVLREYMLGTRVGNSDAIERHLNAVMDNTLEQARQIVGHSYQAKKVVLSGLFATLGGLMGGPAGAVVGGIGGSAILLAAERIDNANIAPWASFFVQEG